MIFNKIIDRQQFLYVHFFLFYFIAMVIINLGVLLEGKNYIAKQNELPAFTM